MTTANNDLRVHPMHARKWVVALQNGHPENVALLHTEMNTGHGPGVARAKQRKVQATKLAFLDEELGFVKTD